ncbi:MAG: Hsp20/alpha crystallin family protein [Candidatus Aenigmatarchaeota archaeon]
MPDEEHEYFWEEPKKPRKVVQKRAQPAVVMGVIGVNVQQAGDTIVVKANVPGFSSNEIHFTVKDGVVQVHGQNEKRNVVKKKEVCREENSASDVAKQFAIPRGIDPRYVEAKKKNGVLEIFLRKRKKVKD